MPKNSSQKSRRGNPAASPSLVRSWLDQDLSIPGRTRADALRDLNDECGTATTHSRLNEWLRADLEPSRSVRNYMLRCCIQRVLRMHGVLADTLTDEQLDMIADDLS